MPGRPRRHVVVVAFIAMCALVFPGCDNVERSLIFPGAATQGARDAIVPPSPDYELVQLTTRSGNRIVAQFGRALGRQATPTDATTTRQPALIFFYGNGSCLAYSQDLFEEFRRLGVSVIIPEYPGYGMSAGSPSEEAFYEAADSAYDYLLSRADVDPQQIIAAGWSMGAAVAIDLASRRPITHLITFSAFTTMRAVARHVAPWAPTSLLIRSRFDNAEKLPRTSAPVLLIHGGIDSLVPVEMSAELEKIARGPATRLVLPGVSHNDIFAVGGETMWGAIRRHLAVAR